MGSYISLTPSLLVLITGFVMLMASAFSDLKKETGIKINIALLLFILLVQIGVFPVLGEFKSETIFFGSLYIDKMGGFFSLLFISLTALFLYSTLYSKDERYYKTEFLPLTNFALFGMMIMAMSAEFMTLLIALEILSLSIYTLIGLNREKSEVVEALLKYFLLGSFVGAFYLLGTALIFGATGSTKFNDIALYLTASDISPLVLLSLLFILVTLLFKVTAFGFYNWSIDVYFGSSVNISGYLSTAVKIASFALFIRVLLIGFNGLEEIWQPILYALAILTMFAGNFMSIKQNNIKKLLIASSIVHSGYILINLSSISEISIESFSPTLFYLLAYPIAVMGMFIILTAFSKEDESNLNIEDFKGLYHQYPIMSLAIVIFMLSFIGFPYTVGFFGKFHLFSSAIANGKTELAILGIINTIISVYYYLKIIISMYFYEREVKLEYKTSNGLRIAVVLLAVTVLLGGFGVYNIGNVSGIFY